jgi:hypothetical protein
MNYYRPRKLSMFHSPGFPMGLTYSTPRAPGPSVSTFVINVASFIIKLDILRNIEGDGRPNDGKPESFVEIMPAEV